MIWKIWKKSKLKSEKVWKIWKKGKLNSEMIWKIWKISVLVIITPKETSTSSSSSSIPHPLSPPPVTDISSVVFQALRFEKVRAKSTGK
jgi:hypothetical protein